MTYLGIIAGLTVATGLIAAGVSHRDRLLVVDGDTISISGDRIRLVGYDAPETGANARCRAEEDLGEQAKERLAELIATTDISIIPVECACRPGTAGTRRCNFSRRCAILRSNGQDVGDILISEGLAAPYICGATRCPRRRSWCGGAP